MMAVVDIPGLLTAVAALVGSLGGAYAVARRVGKPNGQGDVVEMSERQLDLLLEIREELGSQRSRLDQLEATVYRWHP
jgi:hypothetical protein